MEYKTIQRLQRDFSKTFRKKTMLFDKLIQVEKEMKSVKAEIGLDQKILIKGTKHTSFPTQSKKQLEQRIKKSTFKLQTLNEQKINIQKELNQANKNICKLIQKEQKKV